MPLLAARRSRTMDPHAGAFPSEEQEPGSGQQQKTMPPILLSCPSDEGREGEDEEHGENAKLAVTVNTATTSDYKVLMPATPNPPSLSTTSLFPSPPADSPSPADLLRSELNLSSSSSSSSSSSTSKRSSPSKEVNNRSHGNMLDDDDEFDLVSRASSAYYLAAAAAQDPLVLRVKDSLDGMEDETETETETHGVDEEEIAPAKDEPAVAKDNNDETTLMVAQQEEKETGPINSTTPTTTPLIDDLSHISICQEGNDGHDDDCPPSTTEPKLVGKEAGKEDEKVDEQPLQPKEETAREEVLPKSPFRDERVVQDASPVAAPTTTANTADPLEIVVSPPPSPPDPPELKTEDPPSVQDLRSRHAALLEETRRLTKELADDDLSLVATATPAALLVDPPGKNDSQSTDDEEDVPHDEPRRATPTARLCEVRKRHADILEKTQQLLKRDHPVGGSNSSPSSSMDEQQYEGKLQALRDEIETLQAANRLLASTGLGTGVSHLHVPSPRRSASLAPRPPIRTPTSTMGARSFVAAPRPELLERCFGGRKKTPIHKTLRLPENTTSTAPTEPTVATGKSEEEFSLLLDTRSPAMKTQDSSLMDDDFTVVTPSSVTICEHRRQRRKQQQQLQQHQQQQSPMRRVDELNQHAADVTRSYAESHRLLKAVVDLVQTAEASPLRTSVLRMIDGCSASSSSSSSEDEEEQGALSS